MLALVFTVLCAAFFVIYFFAARKWAKAAENRRHEIMPPKVPLTAAVALVAAVFVCGFTTVKNGTVGVADTFGSVADDTIMPGVHFVSPYTSVNGVNVQDREIKEVMDVPTSEGVKWHLEISTIYQIDPASAVKVYRNPGVDNVENVLIIPQVRSISRAVTAGHKAESLYTEVGRLELETQIEERVKKAVEGRGVIIKSMPVRDSHPPETIQEAISAKMVSEQQSKAMEFVLKKESQEAERKTIEAGGIAAFQKIVAEGISPQLLEWKGIEATELLAKSPNTKVIVIGGGKNGLPLILNTDSAMPPTAPK